MWRQNANALKWIKGKQVRISRHKMCCAACDGKLEKLIIFRVAARLDLHIHIYPLGLIRQGGQKRVNIFFINVLAKSFSGEYLIKLSKYSI